jgi:hypothetical protein
MSYEPMMPSFYLSLWDTLKYLEEVSSVGGRQGQPLSRKAQKLSRWGAGKSRAILMASRSVLQLENRVKRTNWCWSTKWEGTEELGNDGDSFNQPQGLELFL